jgi:hypothetical protein
MAANLDILLNNNDLVFENGDFVIGESDQQHIADTINAFPGWWKEDPADGVGIFQYLNSGGQEQAIARSIKINLQSDGYQVGNPNVTTDLAGSMTIDPQANKI